MAVVFASFLALHGLIHLLGFAKAFGLARLPQLTQPIGPLLGLLWLMAAFCSSPLPRRWSTPLADYRSFGPARLASRGEGRWHEPREYTYIELTLDDVQYNVRSR
jgi:hypothetical protein